MKSILLLASFALSVFAQRATIISPTNGTNITPGSQLIIDVQQKVRFMSFLSAPCRSSIT